MQEITIIPIDKLKIDDMNIRNDFSLHGDNDTSIEELSLSIKSQGLLNPISVRMSNEDHYIIFAGSRRFKALQLLNETNIPCIIHDISEVDATTKSLIENFQRQDNSYSEKTRAFKKLYDTQNKNIMKLSNLVGVKIGTLKRYLTISDLEDEILDALDKRNGERRLTLEVAEKMIHFKSEDRKCIFKTYMSSNLSSKDMMKTIDKIDTSINLTSALINETIDDIKIQEAIDRNIVKKHHPFILDSCNNEVLIEEKYMNSMYQYYASLVGISERSSTYASNVVTSEVASVDGSGDELDKDEIEGSGEGVHSDFEFDINSAFYMCFDTETTGTSKNDQVIQLGYIICDKNRNIIHTYEKILFSEQKSNPFALAVHYIDDDIVSTSKNNPTSEIQKFFNIVQIIQKNNGVVIAHNANFDIRLLKQTTQLDIDSNTIFCTMKAIKNVSTSLRGQNCKNSDVYKFLGGKDLGIMHNALNDARATLFIYYFGLDKNWWNST